MVKITKLDDLELYYFPKNVHTTATTHTLVLHSNITLDDITLSLEDKKNYDDYYVFCYDWTEIPTGEYEYRIDNVELGLVQIGSLPKTMRNSTTKEYNKENTIKQYEI